MEVLAFIVGVVTGLWAFSVIALPVFHGLPKATAWLLRGWVTWVAPAKYLLTVTLWSVLILIMIASLDAISPSLTGALLHSPGLGFGGLLGFWIIGAGGAIFSKSAKLDMHKDFQAFVAPHVTELGAVQVLSKPLARDGTDLER